MQIIGLLEQIEMVCTLVVFNFISAVNIKLCFMCQRVPEHLVKSLKITVTYSDNVI